MSEISVSDFDFEEQRLTALSSQQTQSLDAQLYVQFFKHAELNSFKTREQGRKIFEECIYIRILIPANRLNIIERKATDEDKIRFARSYTQFLDKGESLQIGTLLDQLPGLSASQVLELKHLKVETVEQLAGVPDTTAQLLGTGGQELKLRARKFLDRSANSEQLSETVRTLQGQLAVLMAERAKEVPQADTSVKITPGASPIVAAALAKT